MTKVALVIGVARYGNFNNLEKTVKDAGAIAEILEKDGKYAIEPLPRKLDPNNEFRYEFESDPKKEVKYKDLLAKIKYFLGEQAKGKDALIYFAGHGFVAKNDADDDIGFFAATDSSKDGQNGLSFDIFTKLVAKSELNSLVVLLDCCHAGNLLERSQYQGMQKVFNEKNYYLMAACRGSERAREGKEHGIFTSGLLNVLQAKIKDGERVDLDLLFSEVSKKLQQSGQEVIRTAGGGAITLVDEKAKGNVAPVVDETCPYVGLNAFDEKTAQWFFGRDEALGRLRQKLEQRAFVFVVGVSGSGKSSLVRAKLMPEWADRGYQVFVMKPRTSPLGQLKKVLTDNLNDADQDQIEAIEDLLEGGDLLAAVELMPKKPILLVIDQFEEVFTLCRQKTEQRTFLKMLANVAQTTDVVDLAIVATMRADFLGECTDANLDKIINDQMVWLSPMNEDEFREAIVKPAQVQGYELGEGLLDAILADIENEPNCLPLLEFALQELWTHRDPQTRKLTYAAYRNVLKGIKGALNLHADRLYASQSESKQKWMRRILLNLLQMGQDVKDTRQPKKREALVADGQDDSERKEIEAVLRALEGNAGRLLIASEEDGVAMVDLAHEALMEGWEEFKTWRMDNRVVRRLADRVVKAWEEWKSKGKSEDYFLPPGLMLEVRQQWEKIKPELGDEVQEYYHLSEQHSTNKVASIERNLTEIKLREEAMRVFNLLPAKPLEGLLATIRDVVTSQKILKTVISPIQSNLRNAVQMENELLVAVGMPLCGSGINRVFPWESLCVDIQVRLVQSLLVQMENGLSVVVGTKPCGDGIERVTQWVSFYKNIQELYV